MRNDGTGSTLYAWDYRNRLTDVTFKDGSGAITGSIHYTYADNNNRISQTVKDASGTVTLQEFYIYDGSNLLLVLDGSGNVKNRYFNGPNENQVLAEETNIVSSGAGDTHWALTDHEGSVRDVIDNSGSVLDHIQYDSFGNILSQSNSADAMRLAYTGQQYDSQTGLYYDHARYYDPATGRFLSTDPAGFTAGDENLYRYVRNSPVDNSDPTGLCADSSTGQGDDSGPITPDRAYREYQQALADLNIANGTASADDFRTRRDELISDGLSPDDANAAMTPLIAEANAMANQHMEDVRYATGDLTSLERLQGSGSILANTFSFGYSDAWGWTQSTRYQEDGFDGVRVASSITRDSTIMLATAGSASFVTAGDYLGEAATAVNYAGRGYLAYQSGSVIGGGINDISDGNYGSGAFKIAAGSLGVMGTLTGPLVPKVPVAPVTATLEDSGQIAQRIANVVDDTQVPDWDRPLSDLMSDPNVTSMARVQELARDAAQDKILLNEGIIGAKYEQLVHGGEEVLQRNAVPGADFLTQDATGTLRTVDAVQTGPAQTFPRQWADETFQETVVYHFKKYDKVLADISNLRGLDLQNEVERFISDTAANAGNGVEIFK